MLKKLSGLYMGMVGLTLHFASCGNEPASNPLQIKEVKISFARYDFYKDFSSLDTNNLLQGLTKLKEKYPAFYPLFISELAQLNVHGNDLDTATIRGFLTFKDFRQLFDTVNKVFPDTKKQSRELESLFQHIHYYDSSFSLPQKVYYYAAGLNYAAVILPDNSLGIGLDMFLGRDFLPYAQIRIPEYLTIRNTKENIPIAAARVIYENKYPLSMDDKNLLQIMLDKGREMYFLKKVLPDASDSLLYTINEKQMAWLNENEPLIYNYFIQNNLLYETSGEKIYRYVTDAPTSTGMPPESPGNTGTFIGYKIINAYMKQTGKTLQALLNDTAKAQTVLQIAKYKP